MLVPALAMALAIAPFSNDYVMTLNGAPVGKVRVALSSIEGGFELRYESQTLVRRGPVTTRNEAEARASLSPKLAVERLSSTRKEGGVLVRSVGARRATGGLQLTVTEPSRSNLESQISSGVPSSLAPGLLPEGKKRCIAAIDELTGAPGEVCGLRNGSRVSGTMMGEAFTAELDGDQVRRLELPGQKVVFAVTGAEPTLFAPPDLYGKGIPAEGLTPALAGRPLRVAVTAPKELALELPETASQSIERGPDGTVVTWRPSVPVVKQLLRPFKREGGPLDRIALELQGIPNDRWTKAGVLAKRVAEVVTDKRPAEFERSAERVFEEARGSCVGHTELYLALARRAGLPARRAVGLVAQGERFFAHTWVQVEVEGRWYDVEPTEGEAPPRSARVLFAAGAEAGQAGGLLARANELKLRILP